MDLQLTRLRLENWRNFRSIEVPLAPRVFIVGPNASGKTNFLDAIRFLHDIARPEGSLLRAVSSRGGFSHLRSLHARQESNILVELEFRVGENLWIYELQISGKKSGPLAIERERVTKNGKVLLNRPGPEDLKDRRLREQTHLEQLSQNGAFRELVEALTRVSHVHLVPQVAKNGARSEEPSLRDAPGSNFIDQMAQMSDKKRRGMLTKIGGLLKRAVPQFSQLKVTRDDLGRPHLEANYKHWRPQGGWQNESEFSDGTLRLIGLLWAILNGDAPLLLEEPELSLHLAVVRQLPGLIARASQLQDRQIIVSTHSEEMLDDPGVDPSEIVVLKPTKEHTEVSLASDDEPLVQASKAGVPLGRMISGATKPKGIEQLSLGLGATAR